MCTRYSWLLHMHALFIVKFTSWDLIVDCFLAGRGTEKLFQVTKDYLNNSYCLSFPTNPSSINYLLLSHNLTQDASHLMNCTAGGAWLLLSLGQIENWSDRAMQHGNRPFAKLGHVDCASWLSWSRLPTSGPYPSILFLSIYPSKHLLNVVLYLRISPHVAARST